MVFVIVAVDEFHWQSRIEILPVRSGTVEKVIREVSVRRLQLHFSVILSYGAVRAEALDLVLSFEELQKVLERQPVACAKEFLELKADAKILEWKHPFRLVVDLAHWRDVVEFTASTESKRHDVVKVK